MKKEPVNAVSDELILQRVSGPPYPKKPRLVVQAQSMWTDPAYGCVEWFNYRAPDEKGRAARGLPVDRGRA
jgi:hypothetical protein